MVEVLPFKGLLYNKNRVSIEKVVAPPYDVITPQEQERLYKKNPYNVVRLILGKEFPKDTQKNNKYTRARDYLHNWLSQGVLKKDSCERFYLYRQASSIFLGGWERTALFARVRLEESSKGAILPHEKTLSAPKEDRLRLMRECDTNFSPIFCLFPDSRMEVHRLLTESIQDSPLFRFTDDKGVEHSFWLLEGEDRNRAITEAFVHRSILIADGHHRYETALQYKRERALSHPNFNPQKPYNFVLMALVSMEDPGLLVFPIHRLVRGDLGISIGGFWRRMDRYFEQRAVFQNLDETLKALDKAPTHTFGLYPRGGPFYFMGLRREVDLDKTLSFLPPVLRKSDVVILHSLLIEGILGITFQEVRDKGRLEYYRDPRLALKDVDDGEGSLAVFLRAPTVSEIERVARAGETMPQKSTFFYPKLMTGLVMYPLFQ